MLTLGHANVKLVFLVGQLVPLISSIRLCQRL